MSIREIVHRSVQWLFQRWEALAIAIGWMPRSAHSVKQRTSLFASTQNWLNAWRTLYEIDADGVQLLADGKIDFFGQKTVDVGVPTNWCRDPHTGVQSPLHFGKFLDYRDDKVVGNIKVVWELGRHQHLIPLAVAYACTGERRYRDVVVAQIDGWIDANPYGLGVHWCSSLELALRLISWAVVHSLLVLRDGDEGLFSAVADRETLGQAIYRQAWFMRHYFSLYSSANNHLIGELTGLWVTCQVFDLGSKGEQWAAFAQRELEKQAMLQVHEDGVDREQATYYHLWVLEYLMFAWLVGERCQKPFSPTFRNRIVAMTKFLHDVCPPGGRPPLIGDSDDGFVTRFEARWPRYPYLDVLVSAKCVFGAEWPIGVERIAMPQKAFWYSMIIRKVLNSEAEDKIATVADRCYPFIYPQGGYAILGDEEVHLVFDAGPLGYPSIAAHAHADALSFCLAIRGQWWLVDPGTYAYHSDERWRSYFRGTSAHNTVTVDNRDQSEMGGPFLWRRHAVGRIEKHGMNENAHQWVEGTHDGYRPLGVAHHRRVDFYPSTRQIMISDRIQGNGTHKVAVYFHFAPDIDVSFDPGQHAWVAVKAGCVHKMELKTDLGWQWQVLRGSEDPLLGWYSPALGAKVPTFTLRGVRYGMIPVNLVTSATLKIN